MLKKEFIQNMNNPNLRIIIQSRPGNLFPVFAQSNALLIYGISPEQVRGSENIKIL